MNLRKHLNRLDNQVRPATMILSLLLSLASLTDCTNVWPQNHLGLNPAPPTNYDRLTLQKKIRHDPVPIPGTVSTVANVLKGPNHAAIFQQAQPVKKQQQQSQHSQQL